ncbi:MAG: hypothetical protein LBS19_14610, partial [Clostridiales bacterium]|nr:hypothetical protein [Clostridiales bacterium]
MNPANDLYKQTGSGTNAVLLAASSVVDTLGVTSEDHHKDDRRHLTADNIKTLDGAAKAADLAEEARLRTEADNALSETIIGEASRAA